MKNCIFCKITAKEIPVPIVYETSDVLAFLDASPLSPGHVLVVPKKHSNSITDIEEADLCNVIVAAQKIAKTLQSTLHVEGVNVFQNNGSVAGQAVFHTHFHVIPRSTGDGIRLPQHNENPDLSRQSEIMGKLREALKEN